MKTTCLFGRDTRGWLCPAGTPESWP